VVAVCGLVTNANGRVLLVRVEGRGWELPGGQVERGESLLEALVREVEEESGCVVEPERLLAIDSRLTAPEMLVHVFACRYVDGVPIAREAAVPEVGWFTPQEARRLVTRSPAAERLADALGRHGGVGFRAYRMQPYAEVERRLVGDR
jgi:ADP-ribose pyrophosphatase YjhB (NUDIX family)